MDKRKMLRHLVELGKDILILALMVSAVFLTSRIQTTGSLSGLLQEEHPQTQDGQIQNETRAEAARPLRMTATLPGIGQPGRYGVQYDEAACDALFQQVAGLLREALSSAGAPEPIGRPQWEEALTSAPGVSFDFQGAIPLSVLSGWLSGEEGSLNASVRRVALSVSENTVVLYYRDETDGSYYRCRSEVSDPLHLEEALSGLTDNGAFYAFESDLYSALDPDTLIIPRMGSTAVYTVSAPVSSSQAALETLADELEFAINTNGVYYAGEWVARSDNDTLRLSGQGVMEYLAGSEESIHFPVSGDSLFEAVETCRRLAVTAMGSRMGQARLYLISARQTQEGLDIRFGCSLNGIPVQTESGYAASFLVSSGRVTRFTLHFRSYALSDSKLPVLPPRQAVAALEALGLEGEELTLMYRESGSDTVTAGWSAAAAANGKE